MNQRVISNMPTSAANCPELFSSSSSWSVSRLSLFLNLNCQLINGEGVASFASTCIVKEMDYSIPFSKGGKASKKMIAVCSDDGQHNLAAEAKNCKTACVFWRVTPKNERRRTERW